MTAEHTPSNPNGQDPAQAGGETVSGPPHDLIQYPEKNGVIPLAESYTIGGTDIVWEENPFTRTNRQNQTTERRAIIATDDGNLHYLRGDTLYDFGHSQATGRIQETQWTPRTPMPDVTVGEPASFDPRANVERVLVAAGEVTAGDPRVADLLDNAVEESRNPFDALDKAVDDLRMQHMRAAARRQSNVDLTGLTIPDDDDTDHFPNTYRFRDDRIHDMSGETRNRGLYPHDVDAGVTNTVPGSPEADAEAPEHRITSREGVPISPPARGESSYEPRIIDEFTHGVGETIRHSAPARSFRALSQEIRESLRPNRDPNDPRKL